MKVLKTAICGNDKSNDVLVEVKDGVGININLKSTVEKRFGRHIKKIILDIVQQMNIKNIDINVKDNGALDYAIIARTKQAILNATDCVNYDWSK